MDIFIQIAKSIIKEQERIIGPLAWSEAYKVRGLAIVNPALAEVTINGDGKQVIDSLVSRYERLFGKTSHAVCKQAVANLLVGMPKEAIPQSLI